MTAAQVELRLRCATPNTQRQKYVWDQCRRKHDIVDVLVGLPGSILRLCSTREPYVDDVFAKRFARQKKLNGLS
jgi:hypothetical protein